MGNKVQTSVSLTALCFLLADLLIRRWLVGRSEVCFGELIIKHLFKSEENLFNKNHINYLYKH